MTQLPEERSIDEFNQSTVKCCVTIYEKKENENEDDSDQIKY